LRYKAFIMQNIVQILDIQPVTHDVKSFRIEKPVGYSFLPGHATDVSINKPGLEDEVRPFTFTALASKPYLEFTIKRYPEHHGITDKLHQLKPGDELIIRDSWGAIDYKGAGYFIAGGAGVTPFVAILRSLYAENKIEGNTLFFSNKTAADIIYEKEFLQMLGTRAVFILTNEKTTGYKNTRINEAYLKNNIPDFKKHFYVCGPDPMVVEIVETLQKLGASAETLIFEK
jgi:ferredoxin-NADP reductase